MSFCCIHDRTELTTFFSRNPRLHVYSLGDLDERFRPYTSWYGIKSGGKLVEALCIYQGAIAPTLMALTDENSPAGAMGELLFQTEKLLPDRFYAHLSPGLEKSLPDSRKIVSEKSHYKMTLTAPERLESVDISRAGPLDAEDIPAMLELYKKSYPGNWFEPEKLDINLYFGIKEGPRLISAAGTHVWSRPLEAAALGNICTLPQFRGRGYGAAATAAVCRELNAERTNIGLNVRTDNTAAVECYKKLGFSKIAVFGEFEYGIAADNTV